MKAQCFIFPSSLDDLAEQQIIRGLTEAGATVDRVAKSTQAMQIAVVWYGSAFRRIERDRIILVRYDVEALAAVAKAALDAGNNLVAMTSRVSLNQAVFTVEPAPQRV